MTSGGAPTPPGQRVGALKYQIGNGFRRGQPVYRNPVSGLYTLATTTTGFDGVVGTVKDTNSFEVVSSGELDGLTNLPATTTGTLYLSSVPGGLSATGTVPVLRLSAPTKAIIVQGSAAATASPASTQVFSLTGKSGAAPLGTPANVLDMSWLNLTAIIAAVIAGTPSTFPDNHYVRAPEFGGILDTDPVIGGSLVFDIDRVTQVIDGDNFPL
jgi:hypothetical protein